MACESFAYGKYSAFSWANLQPRQLLKWTIFHSRTFSPSQTETMEVPLE